MKNKPAKNAKPADVKAAPATAKNAKPADVKAAPVAAKIKWLTATNPKRPGTACHERATSYWQTTDVAAYLAKGGTRADLAWDAKHNFIEVQA